MRTTLGPKTREEPVKLRRTRTVLATTSGKLVACDAVGDYEPDDETQMRLFRITRKPR